MKLFFRKEGQGSPLVILHGLFGASDNWMSIGRVLAEQYAVILPDQRNHGLTENTSAFDYSTMADDLQELLEAEQIENPVIIGHSMGGKVAMRFAEKYPDMLSKLVVVDIAPRPYPVHHQTILEGLAAVKPTEINSRKEADTRLAAFVKELPVRQFLLKNLYRTEAGGFDWRINLPVISQKIEQVGEGIEMATPFHKPTLFIGGANSGYIQEKDASTVGKMFPNSQIVTIEGAGHWIHAEKPQEFLQVLRAFLEE